MRYSGACMERDGRSAARGTTVILVLGGSVAGCYQALPYALVAAQTAQSQSAAPPPYQPAPQPAYQAAPRYQAPKAG
jgi:hypothetical protein